MTEKDMEDGKRTLKDKRVLILGGLGFLGINLAKRVAEECASISIVDAVVPTDLDARLAYIGKDIELKKVDIREIQGLRDLVEGQEIIYCFAGISGAAFANKNPQLELSVNCAGCLNILEATRQVASKASIIFPSSWLVYGKLEDETRVIEEHPTKPISIYGIHKLTCENYFRLYHELYGLNTVAFRISNPYGPFQAKGNKQYGIINHFIDAALRDDDLIVFGGGRQRRDYIYIEDLVRLSIRAGLQEDNDGNLFNVGSGLSTSLIDVAELIISKAGSGRIKHVPWPDEYKIIEQGDYHACIDKACEAYEWQPLVDLERGIEETIKVMKVFYGSKL